VHERYRDLPGVPGPETADLVYADESGDLTWELIVHGYFGETETAAATMLQGRRPTYFIEVKTTTVGCEMPFFCSQNQVDMMEEMRLVDGQPADRVYMIARVFNLGSSGMGLKLYLDPATLRANGELEFRADKYVVTPA
jgi:hypothetical protein